MPATRDPLERLLARMEITESGCWVVTSGLLRNGYSQVSIGGRDNHVTVTGHRLVYERMVGPIPDGLQIDHLCHTNDPTCEGGPCRHRACVNPDHLEPVLAAENLRRGMGWSGRNFRKTHCPQGHPYVPENLANEVYGRKCRLCKNARQRRYNERLRLAREQAEMSAVRRAVNA